MSVPHSPQFKDSVVILSSPGDDIEEIVSYHVGSLRSGRRRSRSIENRNVVDLTDEPSLAEDNNSNMADVILLDTPPLDLRIHQRPRNNCLANHARAHVAPTPSPLHATTPTRRRARIPSPEVINVELAQPARSPVQSTGQDTDVILVEQNTNPRVAERTAEGGLESLTPKRRLVTCPICMDHERTIHRTGRQLNSTTCGHIFCSGCLDLLFAQTGPKRCPTCRKKLTKKSYHALFL